MKERNNIFLVAASVFAIVASGFSVYYFLQKDPVDEGLVEKSLAERGDGNRDLEVAIEEEGGMMGQGLIIPPILEEQNYVLPPEEQRGYLRLVGRQDIDLRTHPVITKDIHNEDLDVSIDLETLTRTSKSKTYSDTQVFLKDRNYVYLYYSEFLDNNERGEYDPVTLIVLPHDPRTFSELSRDFVLDKNGIYYLDHTALVSYAEIPPEITSLFVKVDSVDFEAYVAAEREESSLTYINSSYIRKNILIRNNSAYLKDKKIGEFNDMELINWSDGKDQYATPYLRLDEAIFCLSEEADEAINISKAGKSFSPKLISGQTFYAADTERFYINCDVLANKAGTLFPPETVEFKPLYSESGHLNRLYILTKSSLHNSVGQEIVSDIKDPNSFRYLFGDYFVVDGELYHFDRELSVVLSSRGATLVNGGDVDVDTFEIVSSGSMHSREVGKDKDRVYIINYDGTVETFVPKDLASFGVKGCSWMYDKYHVYGRDGNIEEGANPETFNYPCDMG